MNLFHGLTFQARKRKTGSWGKASLILSAVIMDMRGCRIRLSIGGTCWRSRAVCGWYVMLRSVERNMNWRYGGTSRPISRFKAPDLDGWKYQYRDQDRLPA